MFDCKCIGGLYGRRVIRGTVPFRAELLHIHNGANLQDSHIASGSNYVISILVRRSAIVLCPLNQVPGGATVASRVVAFGLYKLAFFQMGHFHFCY